MSAPAPRALRRRLAAGRRDLLAGVDRARRRLDASARALPDFLVVGTQKGGTTSLMKSLAAHPGVVTLPRVGEISYFSTRYDHPEAWYRSHFPTRRALDRRAAELGYRPLTGEKSPTYLDHPWAPDRVGRDLPDVRIVALVRHPIERAISHYDMAVAKQLEPNALLDALADDLARLAPGAELPGARPVDRRGPRSGFRYLRRGLYAEQLANWALHLPDEQRLVLRSEDAAADPAAAVAAVCSFLGLPEEPGLGTRRHNARRPDRVSDRERLGDDAWRVLVEVFAAPNAALAERTGITWDDWA